ncbi:hypothetical protein [Brevibacillus laterosporus]|uniref:hypothetical protein n=1 Tax=Brevibacillus laterosporus TaxID=1465 RepID=UPI00215BE6C7|nr:hypothetical protein [Brevibacillus laterosporus]MCR8994695.1 hypothetical protein [Brevibacillus laterosporus]
MFKNIFGFDKELFLNTAVEIKDGQYNEVRRGKYIAWGKELDYIGKNLTGLYLVQGCYSTEIFVLNKSGDTYEIPVRHFIGEKPRMSIKILQ